MNNLHKRLMGNPEYRAEWERTALARHISERILTYRIEKNLTIKEFGQRVGLTEAQICFLEGGDYTPTTHVLSCLAEVIEL